jgi:hypothetical protein
LLTGVCAHALFSGPELGVSAHRPENRSVDLDEVADELYEVPPEEFIVLRTTRQDEAKAEGDKPLAKEIGSLPKPSAAAWACNVLVRSHREEIEGLVELGGLLREAQENLVGDELRALSSQRAKLVSALTRQAAALARERGRPITSSVADQVEETLRAAMADPEAGEALLSGRLTSSMSYSGMGTTVSRPDLRLVRPVERAPSQPAKPSKATPANTPAKASADERRRARDREQEEARRAAEEKRRRELAEARQAADEATAAADEAQAAAEDERQRFDELDGRRASLDARVAELADELARAEGEVAEVAAQLKRAERRRRSAEHEAAEAVVARERALARVEQLAGEARDRD